MKKTHKGVKQSKIEYKTNGKIFLFFRVPFAWWIDKLINIASRKRSESKKNF